MKQHYPLYMVEFDRNKDVLTTEVPEHEVKVLKVVHGEGKVRVAGLVGDKDDPVTIELDDNADAEIARLQRRYKRVNAPDPVQIAYPNGAEQLERYGFALGRGPVEAAPASLVKRHKQPKADAATDAAPDAKAEGKAAKAK